MKLLALPAVLAGGYYALALVAALRRSRYRPSRTTPPISILKPLHGRDPYLAEALASHAAQDYPEYEIVCAVRPGDPAVEDARAVGRVIEVEPKTANRKVGLVAAAAHDARYPLLLINDADIRVPSDYLRRVVAPLEDPAVGLVTCLYSPQGDNWASRWQALGVATEFVPSVLVARLVGVVEFALGSTMLVRACDVERIGGFEVLGDYLADDYQFGQRIAALGYRIAFVDTVVETHLNSVSWGEAWRHQVRWARTSRFCRPGGYAGYFVTHATPWALLAWLAGAPGIAAFALGVRLAAGLVAGVWLLRNPAVLRLSPLIPLRDLWGFAVWVAGLWGDTVEWRGRRLRLARDGRIISEN